MRATVRPRPAGRARHRILARGDRRGERKDELPGANAAHAKHYDFWMACAERAASPADSRDGHSWSVRGIRGAAGPVRTGLARTRTPWSERHVHRGGGPRSRGPSPGGSRPVPRRRPQAGHAASVK